MTYSMQDLARAWGEPPINGVIRTEPSDFQVIEIPAFAPSGDGEHRILHIRKTGLNTAEVGKRIARLARLQDFRVSWAGMKDRNAVTEQWFSVHIGSHPEPDWSKLEDEQVKLLDVYSHQKKLRPGALKGNQFYLRIRNVEGDRDAMKERYNTILNEGVPNYFTEQRFGRDGGNAERALGMFQHPQKWVKKHEKSLYLSAARSLVFNAVLSERVKNGSWNQLMEGELCQLNGSRCYFPNDNTAETQNRLREFDLHPSGPMPGRGDTGIRSAAKAFEEQILQNYKEYLDGLIQAKLKNDRRALRMEARFFTMQFDGDDVLLNFELSAGSYATAVMRELIEYRLP